MQKKRKCTEEGKSDAPSILEKGKNRKHVNGNPKYLRSLGLPTSQGPKRTQKRVELPEQEVGG